MQRTLSVLVAIILASAFALLEFSGSTLGIVTVHVIVLMAYALMLIGRRLSGPPGRVRRWFTRSEQETGAVLFHVVSIIILVGVFALGLRNGWTARHLPGTVRTVLMTGFLVTALAYGVSMLYELWMAHGHRQVEQRHGTA